MNRGAGVSGRPTRQRIGATLRGRRLGILVFSGLAIRGAAIEWAATRAASVYTTGSYTV